VQLQWLRGTLLSRESTWFQPLQLTCDIPVSSLCFLDATCTAYSTGIPVEVLPDLREHLTESCDVGRPTRELVADFPTVSFSALLAPPTRNNERGNHASTSNAASSSTTSTAASTSPSYSAAVSSDANANANANAGVGLLNGLPCFCKRLAFNP
jgi:hypothetical protein